jgi:hypothetical protein
MNSVCGLDLPLGSASRAAITRRETNASAMPQNDRLPRYTQSVAIAIHFAASFKLWIGMMLQRLLNCLQSCFTTKA